MANVRSILNLTPEAVAAIEEHAPSPNKKGEWTSNVIVDYVRLMSGTSALGDDDDGILERIDSRLARIEQQMVLLLAKE